MTAVCPDAFLSLACDLAATAGEIVRGYFRTSVAIDQKTDLTPVTIADREAEAAMRRLIQETFPDHGIIGEEADAERECVNAEKSRPNSAAETVERHFRQGYCPGEA